MQTERLRFGGAFFIQEVGRAKLPDGEEKRAAAQRAGAFGLREGVVEYWKFKRPLGAACAAARKV